MQPIFKDQGVPYLPGSFPFGSSNAWKCFTGKRSFVDMDAAALEDMPNQNIFGYFIMGQPIWMIGDEDLAKKILIKDFDYFMDRRGIDSKEKYLDSFLTNLKGNDWKRMRSMMTGVFTSGKLRLMTKHITNVGLNFEKYIDDSADKGIEVETKEAGGKMTLDSIATAGFGIEENSFENPKNRFREMTLTLVGAPGYTSVWNMPKILIMMILPFVGKLFGWSMMSKTATNFFVDIITRTYQQRKESKMRRNDVIDVMVDELHKSEESPQEKTYESDFEKDAAIDTTGLASIKDSGKDDITLIIANVLIFFFAGFETTSTGFTIICHKLAIFPECQEKVLDEIDTVIGDDEDVTYEKIQNLKYLDLFITEAFRYSNLLPSVERQCTKDYNLPGTNYIIQKGRFVKVFVEKMQMSDSNFKNPKEFDPENYLPENKPNKFATMLFGQGPRNCIGMRYALLTLKIGIVYMLRAHRLLRSTNTPQAVLRIQTILDRIRFSKFRIRILLESDLISKDFRIFVVICISKLIQDLYSKIIFR